MEGESPLLKEGALSLQTSLSHRELSHRTPLLQERKFVSLFVTAGFCGKVFLSDWEVRDFLQGAAIALVWRGAQFVGIPCTSAEIPPAGAPSGFDGTPQAFALK